VYVIKSRRHSCFAFKPAQGHRVAKHASEHDLDRHVPMQSKICSLIDCAHPTFSNQPLQTILSIDRPLDWQRKAQLTCIFVATFRRTVITSSAGRTFLYEIYILLFEAGEHLALDLLFLINSCLQQRILSNNGNLASNGLEHFSIVCRIGLLRLLFTKQQQSDRALISATHRNNKTDAKLIEPFCFFRWQSIVV